MQQFRHNIDLHCHTTVSDGALSPNELIELAKANGIEVLAVSDHDTLNGFRRSEALADAAGITLIPAAEFSTRIDRTNVHVVALGVNVTHPAMLKAEAFQDEIRLQRAETISAKLEKHLGLSDVFSQVQGIANGSVIGRPHFAKFLVEQGVVSSMDAAFNKFLGAGKIGDIKLIWPEVGDVIECIHEAGGKAVLAHPLKYKMTKTKLSRLIDDFWDMDGDAIEVVSSRQTKDDTGWMLRQVQKRDLLASFGSDFHASTSWSDLGMFSAIPEVGLDFVHNAVLKEPKVLTQVDPLFDKQAEN
ncbi:PHP domain-containing protein [Litoribrevibacter albus]|uniref:5'-3' exoribonuclease n=1 Tax=Litoribrevibacter albus TaxID=1473156 RepID=A0AA37W544_9GAMM|nr:PHP domain-containing protein [Litoribrevibacter albus]GLQ30777.1 5'-3' exoribonuclease [Litoribrevibacter albus]